MGSVRILLKAREEELARFTVLTAFRGIHYPLPEEKPKRKGGRPKGSKNKPKAGGKIKQEILNYLKDGARGTSFLIAYNIGHPEPSVRRTLVAMFRKGTLERTVSKPYHYRLAS